VISIFSFAVWCLGYFILILYLVWNCSRDKRWDLDFRRRCITLFFRFSDGPYYWSLMLIARKFLTTIAPALWDDTEFEVAHMLVVTVVFLYLTGLLKPFRYKRLQIAETCLLLGLVLILTAAMARLSLGKDEGSNVSSANTFVGFFVILTYLMGAGIVVYCAWGYFQFKQRNNNTLRRKFRPVHALAVLRMEGRLNGRQIPTEKEIQDELDKMALLPHSFAEVESLEDTFTEFVSREEWQETIEKQLQEFALKQKAASIKDIFIMAIREKRRVSLGRDVPVAFINPDDED